MSAREKTYSELAVELGITPSAAWKRLNPDRAREYNRRENARRPDRNRSAHAPCIRCGGRRAADRVNKSGLCCGCRAELRDDLWNRALELRRRGLLNVEIAAELDMSRAAVGMLFWTMKQAGVDVPPSPYFVRNRVAA